MMPPGVGATVRGNRMMRRGRRGSRWWRALGPAVLLASLAVPQIAVTSPPIVAFAAPVAGRPELSTYAGAPAAGKPTDVAQQPFGLAVFARCPFRAGPANHVVRLLIDNNEVAFAGAGSLAVAGDGSDPAKAQLAGPYAVAIGQGTQIGYQVTGFDIYIADTFAHQVRKATVTIPSIDNPSGAQTAVIGTIAGTGTFGYAGDQGPAATAKLNSPYGIAWDGKRRTVYVADTLNNRVRAIDGGGIIRTLVAAPLSQPRGLAINGDGLYIADTYNNVVRRFDLVTGSLTTVAGTGNAGYTDGVLATTALLRQPSGLAFDEKAKLYIADTGNNVVRELEGTLSQTPAHNIHIEAGNGTASFAGNGQAPGQAQFAAPAAVLSRLGAGSPLNAAVPAVTGQRYVIDTFNHSVRTFTTNDTDAANNAKPDDDTKPDNDDDDVSTLAGIGGVRGPGIASTQATDKRLAC